MAPRAAISRTSTVGRPSRTERIEQADLLARRTLLSLGGHQRDSQPFVAVDSLLGRSFWSARLCAAAESASAGRD